MDVVIVLFFLVVLVICVGVCLEKLVEEIENSIYTALCFCRTDSDCFRRTQAGTMMMMLVLVRTAGCESSAFNLPS